MFEMEQIFKDRLLYLANFLETHKFDNNDFDLSEWQCGTSSCAVGWACSLEYFNKQGLVFTTGICPVPFYHKDHKYELVGWIGVQYFFGLASRLDADKLFASWAYPEDDVNNPLAVAERIRNYVKEH